MTFLDLLIYSLACFRLSLLLTVEDGPAFIFRKLRNVPPQKSSLHKGIRCQWCAGIWMSIVVMACHFYRATIPWIEPLFIWPLAVAAVSIVVNQQWVKE